MNALQDRITANLARIQHRIAAACERAGRSIDEVQLVAVTKYARPEWVQELVGIGQQTLGESRPQQLDERAGQFSGDVEWHLIGHLQRNKVRMLLPHVGMIHSVDSLRLATRISQVACDLGLCPRLLIEVNVSGEPSKDGYTETQLRTDWGTLTALDNIEIAGLMTMAPVANAPSSQSSSAQSTFQGLRKLRDDLSSDDVSLRQLSMGMSGDFEVAIAEGATLIRIGSALFDGLPDDRLS